MLCVDLVDLIQFKAIDSTDSDSGLFYLLLKLRFVNSEILKELKNSIRP